jgi:hypothetical protein
MDLLPHRYSIANNQLRMERVHLIQEKNLTGVQGTVGKFKQTGRPKQRILRGVLSFFFDEGGCFALVRRHLGENRTKQ